MTAIILKNRKTGEVRRCRMITGEFGMRYYEMLYPPHGSSITLSASLVDPDGSYRDRSWKVVRTTSVGPN